MRFSWITPKILEIRFDKSYDLCHATYVFSHHYEDPTWHGKVFTRLELDEFYEQNYADCNWWKNRWAGSNLPDHSFEPFLDGRFIGLTDFEEMVLATIRGIDAPFYVIMTSEEALYARDHEIAHALYHTIPEYQTRAQAIVDRYRDQLGEATQKLGQFGYADKVLEDELHVYCGIYHEYFKRSGVLTPADMQQELTALFDEFKP